MKNIFLSLLAVLAITSCSNETTTPTPTVQYTIPLTIGNRWIYLSTYAYSGGQQQTYIDTLTLQQSDNTTESGCYDFKTNFSAPTKALFFYNTQYFRRTGDSLMIYAHEDWQKGFHFGIADIISGTTMQMNYTVGSNTYARYRIMSEPTLVTLPNGQQVQGKAITWTSHKYSDVNTLFTREILKFVDNVGLVEYSWEGLNGTTNSGATKITMKLTSYTLK